ncbi:MAG: YtxH domain-containing protein [Nitrososphaerales archaeon]
MEENNGGGSFVLGFLIGAIAGAAAALLLTPQSGEETRRAIGQKSVELKDEATRQAQRLATDAKGQVEYVQEKGRVVISDNVRKAQDLVTGSQGKPAGELPPTVA